MKQFSLICTRKWTKMKLTFFYEWNILSPWQIICEINLSKMKSDYFLNLLATQSSCISTLFFKCRHESQLCCDFTVADPRTPAADECRIFTLRSWIWAWCTEKAFRHTQEDRLNTAAESGVIRLLTKLRKTAKTHSSKESNSCVLNSSEFLVLYSPYISVWHFKKVHCCV